MRVLVPFAAFGVLLAAYSGYWLYLSHAVENSVLGELRTNWSEAGFEIKHGVLSVGGYPYRIELTLRDVEVGTQNSAISFRWRTPIVLATAHPWELSHWVVVAERPSDMNFGMGQDRIVDLLIGRGRMSLKLASDNVPERVSFDVRDVQMQQSVAPDVLDIKHAELHIRRVPTQSPSLDVAVFVKEIIVGESHGYPVGNRVQELNAEISLQGPAPASWSRSEFDAWRNAGGVVDVHNFQISWGDLELRFDGTFAIDEAYRPIGAASADIIGHGYVLTALSTEGIISEASALAAGIALNFLTEPSSDDGRRVLRAPIMVQDGYLHIGPVALVPLPALFSP